MFYSLKIGFWEMRPSRF